MVHKHFIVATGADRRGAAPASAAQSPASGSTDAVARSGAGPRHGHRIARHHAMPSSPVKAPAAAAARRSGGAGGAGAPGLLWTALDAAVSVLAAASTLLVVALLALHGTPDLGALVAVVWLLQVLHSQLKVLRAGRSALAVVAAPDQAPATPAPALAPPAIAGAWVKDPAASDSLEPIMEAMRLNGLLRAAIRLLKNVDVKLDEERFSFGLFSAVKWFKIVEGFSMDGSVSYLRRRDLRGGKQRGTVRVTSRGTLLVAYEWDAPLAGRGEDEFELSKGRLLVHSANWVGGREIRYTQTYVRRG